MIKSIFIWWWHGLLAWFPESIISKLPGRKRVECSVTGDLVMLSLIDSKGERKSEIHFSLTSQQLEQAEIDAWLTKHRNCRLILVLDDNHSLETQFHMPKQSEDNLAAMVKFEIDRQTPFAIDDVLYDFQGKGEGDEAKLLAVNLTVVPRSIVDRFTASLEDKLLIPISGVRLSSSQRLIDIPEAEYKREYSLLEKSNIILLFVALILFALLLCKPIWYYKKQIKAETPELNEMKKQAHEVQLLFLRLP